MVEHRRSGPSTLARFRVTTIGRFWVTAEDVVFPNFSGDIVTIEALNTAIELVIVEVEIIKDLTHADEAADLSGIIIIEADEDSTSRHESFLRE